LTEFTINQKVELFVLSCTRNALNRSRISLWPLELLDHSRCENNSSISLFVQ